MPLKFGRIMSRKGKKKKKKKEMPHEDKRKGTHGRSVLVIRCIMKTVSLTIMANLLSG